MCVSTLYHPRTGVCCHSFFLSRELVGHRSEFVYFCYLYKAGLQIRKRSIPDHIANLGGGAGIR